MKTMMIGAGQPPRNQSEMNKTKGTNTHGNENICGKKKTKTLASKRRETRGCNTCDLPILGMPFFHDGCPWAVAVMTMMSKLVPSFSFSSSPSLPPLCYSGEVLLRLVSTRPAIATLFATPAILPLRFSLRLCSAPASTIPASSISSSS